MINVLETILTINPNAQVTVKGDDIDSIVWSKSTVAISKADIQAKLTELQTEYDAQDYARKRAVEYGMLNQYEMMFDDQRDGTATWVDSINAIKSKYPKP